MNWLRKLMVNPYLQVMPLTPEDQLELDPTGKAREFINKVTSVEKNCPTPQSPDTRRYTIEQWFAWLDEWRQRQFTDRHRPLWEFDAEMRMKCGRQGGIPPFSDILPSIEEMYERAHFPRKFHYTVIGFRYICSRVQDAVSKYGVPQPSPITYLSTNASLPSMGKKGSYRAETESLAPYRHLFPDLVGTRFQFMKPRLIHQDAVGNVRQVEEYLSRVRKWLTQYLPDLFGCWINPNSARGYAPQITDAVQRQDINLEGDYHHMDAGYGRACGDLVLPIYELLLAPAEFRQLSYYMDELWTQPMYFGSVLLLGEHDLFSGVGPTQDFETIFSAALHCGADIATGSKSVLKLFIGDDSLITWGRRDLSRARDARDIIHEESAATGCIMHPEKTRFNTGDIRFCKRVWYPAAPKIWRDGVQFAPGAYSPSRTMTTIVCPERSVKPQYLISAQLQRCDNLLGTPGWHSFVEVIYSRVTWELPTPEYFEWGVELDWWDRVYGERWSPLSSPTYSWLAQRPTK